MLLVIVVLGLMIAFVRQAPTVVNQGYLLYSPSSPFYGTTFDSINNYFIAVEDTRFFGMVYTSVATETLPTVVPGGLLRGVEYNKDCACIVLIGINKIHIYSINAGFSAFVLQTSNSNTNHHTCVEWFQASSYFFTGLFNGTVLKYSMSGAIAYVGQLSVTGSSIARIRRDYTDTSKTVGCRDLLKVLCAGIWKLAFWPP